MRTRDAIAGISTLTLLAAWAGDAGAAPPPAARPAASWFSDGERRVEVERLGAAASARSGRALAPVRLRYPGGRTALAHVDHTAIVRLDPDGEAALSGNGVRKVRPLMPSIGLWLVEDEGPGDGLDVAQRLGDRAARGGGLREALPNLHLRLKAFGEPFTPDDPRLPGQWYFEGLRMTEAWGRAKGDPATSIVIVDNGCDLAHPDLAAHLDPGRDVIDGDDDPTPEGDLVSANHGTACAGLAAAVTDNGVGIAGGCPECRLRCVRLLNDEPQPLSASIDAFQFALEVNASVVSNSWGYVDPIPVPQPLADAINNVFDQGRSGKGALVLFAAGNDDRDIADDELQAVRGVLTVGAVNHLEEQTQFTNRGNAVDLVAPTGTLSTDISGPGGASETDYTESFGGTSSACPVAAGVAGLLASAAPDRTAGELYDVMTGTARAAPYATPDDKGHDPIYGYGIIEPVAALDALLAPEQPPPPPPDEPMAAPEEASDDAGCACAAVGTAPEGPAGLVAAALALGWARRRRPRGRAIA
jgi:serine protease